MQHKPQQEEPCVKSRGLWLLLALLLAVILLLFGCLLLQAGKENGFFDKDAGEISLTGKTPEEIQAELNRVVEEGMFHISILPQIHFADGTSPGEMRAENTKANHYHMKISIALDDTGEVVYTSGGIKPGQGISEITLARDLPAGSYAATATFTAFEQESLQEIGQAAANITIVVEQ